MTKAHQFPRNTPLINYQQQAAYALEAFRRAFECEKVGRWYRQAYEMLECLQRQDHGIVAERISRAFQRTLSSLEQEMRRASPQLDHIYGDRLRGYVAASLMSATGCEDWESICPRKLSGLLLPDGTPNIIKLSPEGAALHWQDVEATPLMRQQVLEYSDRAIAPRLPPGRHDWSGRFDSPEEFRRTVVRDVVALMTADPPKKPTMDELATLWHERDPTVFSDSMVTRIKRYCRKSGYTWKALKTQAIQQAKRPPT